MWKKKLSYMILTLMLGGLIGCGGKDGPAEVPKNPAPIPQNGPVVRIGGDANTKTKSLTISSKFKPQ